jgi:hypothetical protein
MNKLILQRQKSAALCTRASFYKLFRNQNLDYTTTDLFSPPDVKADILIFL